MLIPQRVNALTYIIRVMTEVAYNHDDVIEKVVSLTEPTIAVGANRTDVSLIVSHCLTSRGIDPNRQLTLVVSEKTHATLLDSIMTSCMTNQLLREGYIDYRVEENVSDRVIATSDEAICLQGQEDHVFRAHSSQCSSVFQSYSERLPESSGTELGSITLSQLNISAKRFLGDDFQDILGATNVSFARIEPLFEYPGRYFISYIMLLAAYVGKEYKYVREFIQHHNIRGEYTISSVKSEIESETTVYFGRNTSPDSNTLYRVEMDDRPSDSNLDEWIVSTLNSLDC